VRVERQRVRAHDEEKGIMLPDRILPLAFISILAVGQSLSASLVLDAVLPMYRTYSDREWNKWSGRASHSALGLGVELSGATVSTRGTACLSLYS
jgi:hypothetical protein